MLVVTTWIPAKSAKTSVPSSMEIKYSTLDQRTTICPSGSASSGSIFGIPKFGMVTPMMVKSDPTKDPDFQKVVRTFLTTKPSHARAVKKKAAKKAAKRRAKS